MLKRTYLLGAGFSVACGLPTTNFLKERILSDIAKSRNITIDPCKQKLIELLKSETSVDKLLCKLDKEIAGGQTTEEMKFLRYKLSGILKNYFLYEIHGSLPSCYELFAEILQKGDNIISFNFDPIIEMQLWKMKKWHFIDGYGFQKNPSDFSSWKDHYSPGWKSEITVWKPNGSANWIRSRDGHKIGLELPEHLFPFTDGHRSEIEEGFQTDMAASDGATTLIEPGCSKNQNTVMGKLREKITKTVCPQIEEIISIGYSLPDYDIFARDFFKEAKIKKITVIVGFNPNNTIQKNYENVVKNVEVEIVREYFEQWIKSKSKSCFSKK